MTTPRPTVAEDTIGRLTPEDRHMARTAEEQLRRLLEASGPVSGRASLELCFRENSEERHEVVALPPSALQLLNTILEAQANGHAVTVMPSHGELTPNQAADILGVSRPFLIKLLDEGKIPFRRVGAHRRIRVDALSLYQKQEEKRQLDVLAGLQAQAQELDMGY